MLNFAKCFFYIYWNDHLIFLLYSVNIMNYTDWYFNVKWLCQIFGITFCWFYKINWEVLTSFSIFSWIFEFYFIYFFIQQVLISHQFYTHQCIHVNSNRPIHHATTPNTPPQPCCFPPLVSIRLLSTSVSQFLPWKPVHLYHFSRFHIYALIYDICFSLSDLLHSGWQSLDPSTSQQMIQFFSFLWLSNIPLYIYIPHLLYPFLCWWTFRLLPCLGYCKEIGRASCRERV